MIIRTRPDHRLYAVGEPPQNNDILQPRVAGGPAHAGRCPGCNRFYSVSVNPFLYQWEEDETLVGLEAETGFNTTVMWVTTDDKAAELKACESSICCVAQTGKTSNRRAKGKTDKEARLGP